MQQKITCKTKTAGQMLLLLFKERRLQIQKKERNAALFGWCPMTSQDTYHGKKRPTGCLSELLLYGRLFSACHAYILLTISSETLAANSSDPEANAVAIRKICLGWFQNARDKSGGRSKRRYTCPKMPLVIIISLHFILYFPAGTEQGECVSGSRK
ncbi:unnamed protein product [Calicophoron daubneyi]|uniref:Uncharacterized protein n=1 Tax=Calicophoron daubneyi TaxID=300641 RepID=A0AAV2T4B6_CALDB